MVFWNTQTANWTLMFLYIFNLDLLLVACTETRNVTSVAFSHVEMTPLWNASKNETSCMIQNRTQLRTSTIHGSADEICSVQVIVPPEVQITIHLNKNTPDVSYLFNVERKGGTITCGKKFVVVRDNRVNESCQATFRHGNLQLNLHGDIAINISTTLVDDSVFACPETIAKSMSDPDPFLCHSVHGYDVTYACPGFTPVPGICTMNFQSKCESFIENNVVTFECLNETDYDTQTGMIIYPYDMIALDLSANNIVSLASTAFHAIHSIQRLYLTFNKLRRLAADTFRSLSKLFLLDLSENKLQELDGSIFQNLRRLGLLFLQNNELTVLPRQLFEGSPNLLNLFLFGNRISALHSGTFNSLHRLNVLLLHINRLETLERSLFIDLRNLEILVLSSNQISTLETGIFDNLINLDTLYLPSNQLKTLDNDIFKQNTKLTEIDLSSNYLKKIPSIGNLINLNRLDLQDNPLTDINSRYLAKLAKSAVVFASQHEICECFIPFNVSCSAADDHSPYLSCDRLLSDTVLSTMMWLIGISALAGNVFVLTWRRKTSQRNKVQDILLSNLALADLIMGVYMLLIASADVYFGDFFPMQSETWRTGITCRIAGALSFSSSEASVFFVTIISIDRFACIKYPQISKTLKTKLCYISVTLTWLLSAIIGIIPSALSGINFKFYDNSHVCIGLPLSLTQTYSSYEIRKEVCPQEGDRESCYSIPLLITESGPLVSGMYFSSAIFLGLNCVCYLAILACYVEVIRVVYKSSKRAGLNKEMKEQMRLTLKVAAIVATDFACWFPVILLGILVQARVVTLPPSVYAWCVTFVLPINSAINPYLYTIAAIISSRRKRKVGDTSTSQSGSQQQVAGGSGSRQAHTIPTVS